MNITLIEVFGLGVGAIVVGSLLKAHESMKESKKTANAENMVVNPTTIPTISIEHEGYGLINQVDKKNRQGEPYPIAYDPANDFLPRYRWPDGSVWSPEYNPVDSFRPLDYQVSQVGGSYYV
jgi:hypothetical protein